MILIFLCLLGSSLSFLVMILLGLLLFRINKYLYVYESLMMNLRSDELTIESFREETNGSIAKISKDIKELQNTLTRLSKRA
jgi:hypothetical protein